MQGVLAGLPSGIPGIGLEIEGAVQHAPQPGRHSIRCSLKVNHRIDERAQYHLFCTSKSANTTCPKGPSRVLCRDIFDIFDYRNFSMPRANEIKKGMVLNYNGKLLLVKDIDIQSPTARGAATLYKMRFSDVRTGLKVEERLKGDDIVDTVTLTRRYVDFSYVDGNEYVFMDKEDYTPYTFTKDQIEEELLFMPEGGMPDMQVLTWDGQLLALELPQTVDLEIVETAP